MSQSHPHDHLDRRSRHTPLAAGVGYRLGWALGLSAVLWLTVFWALS